MILLDPALLDPLLLDPDLRPAPTPKTHRRIRVVASHSISSQGSFNRTTSRDVHIPSARALARFLTVAQDAARLKGQVTVLLTTDAAIKKLNRQFRGKNKATDVLSFPAEGLGAQGIAGDLAISVTTALGQAAEQGHSLATEIKVLVLHGLLHLAGYDHETDEGQMERRERLLRARLKLPQGLIERAGKPTGTGDSPSHSRRRGAAKTGRPALGKGFVKSSLGVKGPEPTVNQSARWKSGSVTRPADRKLKKQAKRV